MGSATNYESMEEIAIIGMGAFSRPKILKRVLAEFAGWCGVSFCLHG